MKVLFVCLGNICRSPLAEAIFAQRLRERGLQDAVSADSCGTAAYHLGESPDSRTVEVAGKNDIPMNHRGRQLDQKDFYEFDHILAMDLANLGDARMVQPSDGTATLKLIRDFDPDPADGQVPDPYWGGGQEFQGVFDILDRSIDGFINQVLDSK